jgi:hypothetical protein
MSGKVAYYHAAFHVSKPIIAKGLLILGVGQSLPGFWSDFYLEAADQCNEVTT